MDMSAILVCFWKLLGYKYYRSNYKLLYWCVIMFGNISGVFFLLSKCWKTANGMNYGMLCNNKCKYACKIGDEATADSMSV